MKQALALAVMTLGLSAFGVTLTSTVECNPLSGIGPTYKISSTSGGAPGYPVSYLSVTRSVPGYADVTATMDLFQGGKDALNYGVGPFEDGSAFLYSRTFAWYDEASRKVTSKGYISVYVRSSAGVSLLDVQMPSDVEHADEVNTTPPLSGYSCRQYYH